MPYYETPEGPAKKKRLADYKKRAKKNKRVEYTPPKTNQEWKAMRARQAEARKPGAQKKVEEMGRTITKPMRAVDKLMKAFGISGKKKKKK